MPNISNEGSPRRKRSLWSRVLRTLGPGLVTGASDDDPSGIATYSQAGAAFGLATLWTALISLPLMVAVQEMCARIGIVTRQGLTGVLRRHYPKPVLYTMLLLSIPAIILNIGADLQAMGAVVHMLFPDIPAHGASIFFTAMLLVVVILLPYRRLAAFLKYLCVSLLLYMVVPFLLRLDWNDVWRHSILPTWRWDREYLAVLVGILGTTISPYLFFWQTSMEVEETQGKLNTLMIDKRLITNMRWDVDIGMFLSCLVFYFIILTTGTVLHTSGIQNITTVEEAAMALRPLAGDHAYWLFALGVIGTGMLAIPVLGGAVSYILAETLELEEGMDKKYYEAPGFYAVLTVSLALGLLFDFTGISAIDALLWTAVLYGVTAPVLIVFVLMICNNKAIMGPFVNKFWSNALGVIAVLLMGTAAVFLLMNLVS